MSKLRDQLDALYGDDNEAMVAAKAERKEAVARITVTVDGMTFDGDEDSQTRMARSITALSDGESMPWVLADNSIARPTKEQLVQALRLCGEAQTALWVKPYES